MHLVSLPTVSLFFASSFASPHSKRSVSGPVIDADFPDPAIIKTGGTWYAFATGTGDRPGIKTQIASSPDFETWTVLDQDALGTLPSWVNETSPNVWAPDVIRRKDGKFLMYFAATTTTAGEDRFHCVGTAVSDSVEGPYDSNSDTPLACPTDQGGAIDASGFRDADGARYVLYKIDANALGNGGSCGNTVPPILSTPIMIQRVKQDGFTPVGEAVELITNDEADGPLVEAPAMRKYGDTYFLFFSSNCYDSDLYDVSYATSASPTGGFVKTDTPLFVTGDHGLIGPGGADVRGKHMAFHGYRSEDDLGGPRAMYVATLTVDGDTVSA